MAKNQDKVKKKLLDELEKVPIIQYACQKAGISRSTFYRWVEEDDQFAEDSRAAVEKGIDVINDLAESQLINNVKNGHFGSITYWLKFNHERYRPKYLNYKRHGKSIWDRQPLRTIIEFIGKDPDDNQKY